MLNPPKNGFWRGSICGLTSTYESTSILYLCYLTALVLISLNKRRIRVFCATPDSHLTLIMNLTLHFKMSHYIDVIYDTYHYKILLHMIWQAQSIDWLSLYQILIPFQQLGLEHYGDFVYAAGKFDLLGTMSSHLLQRGNSFEISAYWALLGPLP